MKTNNVRWVAVLLFCGAISVLSSCTSEEPIGKSQVEFQLTDSPTDDANIVGVFVTITDIQVDGKSIPGYTTQTVHVNAYQDGETRLLGSALIDAKQYSNVTLVLDADTDGAGNSPGCYVLTRDGSKFKLNGAQNLVMNKDFSFAANSKSTVLVEFDVRKAVRAVPDPAVRYDFASNENLQKSVRLVDMGAAGSVRGTYNGNDLGESEKVVVYAYQRGTFNAATEVQPEGDGVRFENSVSSAPIKLDFTSQVFQLSYLEAGDYELQYAVYRKPPGSDQFVFDSMLAPGGGGSVGDIVSIQPGTTIFIASSVSI